MYKFCGALIITLLVAVRLPAQDNAGFGQLLPATGAYPGALTSVEQLPVTTQVGSQQQLPTAAASLKTIPTPASSGIRMLPPTPGSDTFNLQTFNQQRMHTTQTAMIVLGGWAVANIATGLVAMGQTSGEAKYFHQMNAIWNVVNLGIATAGYFGSRKLNGTSWNMSGSIKEQNKIEKIYLVNGALDVAYILGGLYAREYGKNQSGKEQDRWKGYGSSIILQGGFLLLYDAVNLTIHHRHGKGLYQRFENVQVSFSPGRVVAGVTF
ncbi:DUF6992 family protein [Chitinophaga arvensicola]|uniref:Outer membrane protein beta-barrel domain-containing protein n=1 Tax=Chitinophaga arvensicola TaxID=29529 RepID=A0A1I0QFA2_9BACT|nr:hypothetical protein [Chitinophaga arvensicola]SEW25782.1 hypothetical protein SAMN04488122_1433 [Chitinophaga arvensicola]